MSTSFDSPYRSKRKSRLPGSDRRPIHPHLTSNDLSFQAEAARTYVAKGGSLELWLLSKDFGPTGRAAVLARLVRDQLSLHTNVIQAYQTPFWPTSGKNNVVRNNNTGESKLKISNSFPSKYLKADDLVGQTVSVTINKVVDTDVSGKGEAVSFRPVVFFQGHQKGLVLNKTNASKIAAIHGDETEDWPGAELELFGTTTEFRGETVPCIRLRVSGSAPAPTPLPPEAEHGIAGEPVF